MYPNSASMQQQWAAYAALSAQPGIQSGQSITINPLVPTIVDSTNMILRTLGPGIVRQPPNAAHPLPGPTVPPTPGSYPPHPALGYTFHQSLETAGANPQFSNPYGLPPYAQPGSSCSHHLSLSHSTTLPYAQSIPYLSTPLMPTICNGTLNPIAAVAAQGIPTGAPLHHHQPQPHHQPHHAQQQQVAFAAAAALAAANNNSVRTFDSLKHFGALPQGQQTRRSKPMITSKTNLYISGLSESDTDDTVRSLVETIVNPKSCKAMVISGKCKGSGFIDCASEEDAEKAKTHILEVARRTGRKLSVKYAFENEKDALNVYVRHLPRSEFTKDNLYDMFRHYGNITSVKLMEADGCLTGIGFVRFSTAEQAERAVKQMNEARCIMDDDKPVTCKLADKADPRRRTSTSTATVAPNAAATAAAMAVAAAAMMQQQQQHSRQPAQQLLRTPHTQNPVGHIPMAAVVPPQRGLLAPSGALLSAAHNGAMLTSAGAPTNNVNAHAVLPGHFATSPPPQPGIMTNHHILGNNLPSLPTHMGQSSMIAGSLTLPLKPGVADFQKPNAPLPVVNSNSIILSDVAAPCVTESTTIPGNAVVVGSLSTPGAYEMNGAAMAEVISSCSNDQSSYPVMLPTQDTPAIESNDEQPSNVAGQPSPPIVGSTTSPFTNRQQQQQQQQQVFMYVNPSSCTYQNTTPTLASTGTASLLSQQVNYVVTSATTTATAFDSATGCSQDMRQHQSSVAEMDNTGVVVIGPSQRGSPFVHASDENCPRGSATVEDKNRIDIISSTFQTMSFNDARRTTLSSESTPESPLKSVVADPQNTVATNPTSDSNHNVTFPHQAVDTSNDYLSRKEHTNRGSTTPSQLSRMQTVEEHQSDACASSDNRSPQKSHTGNDVYSGAVEITPPRRSLLTQSAAARQPASGKRHQETSGNSLATTTSNYRGRRRSEGANSARSKRLPAQNASGVRIYYTMTSSPPFMESTKPAATSVVNREVNPSGHCTPEAAHEPAVEPGLDYRG